MWFILLCIAVGALIMVPAFRQFVGQGCLLFIVGFLAIMGGLLFLAGLLSFTH